MMLEQKYETNLSDDLAKADYLEGVFICQVISDINRENL
jgi:hypothetical protein